MLLITKLYKLWNTVTENITIHHKTNIRCVLEQFIQLQNK